MQFLLCLAQCDVAFQWLGRRNKLADKVCCSVHKDAAWFSGGHFDAATSRRFCGGGDIGNFHCAAVGPASMAVDALKPNWPVANGSIKVLRVREAAKAPFFLVPTATNNPTAFRIFRCISRDRRLRFGKAIGRGQIKRQQLKAKPHDVAVRVNQARQ